MLYSGAMRGGRICMQTDLCSCSVNKGIFLGYTFTKRFSYSDHIQRTVLIRVRSSSICLNLRLNLGIIFIHYI